MWCFSSVRFDLRRDFHKEAAAYRPALPLSIPILAIWLAIGWLLGEISETFHFHNGSLLVPIFLGASGGGSEARDFDRQLILRWNQMYRARAYGNDDFIPFGIPALNETLSLD